MTTMKINPHPRIKEVPKGLTADHLSKSYKKRPVLRNVSFSLQRGEAVALLGPNGAGKTTCFYIIMGQITPDGGYIQLDGQDITSLPTYRRSRLGVGYLPQEASIFRGLSVEDNLRLVIEAQELSTEDQDMLLEDLLSEFGIEHLRRTPSLALSGGERRRVEIARALAARPQFMLLDEPFAGIDPIAIDDIQQVILKLRDKGIGVLITDHNVRETLSITNRAYIISEGTIFRSGTPSQLANDPEVRRVYLGEKFRL